jgi:hypothetical protein
MENISFGGDTSVSSSAPAVEANDDFEETPFVGFPTCLSSASEDEEAHMLSPFLLFEIVEFTLRCASLALER